MSLQERTLVVKGFDPDKATKNLLLELFMQSGPVKNIVIRPDHAFVEFEDVESVGYSKALLEGTELHGKKLKLDAKVSNQSTLKFCDMLQNFVKFMREQQIVIQQQQQQMMMNMNTIEVPQMLVAVPQDIPQMQIYPSIAQPNISLFAPTSNHIVPQIPIPQHEFSNFTAHNSSMPPTNNNGGWGLCMQDNRPPRHHPYQNNNVRFNNQRQQQQFPKNHSSHHNKRNKNWRTNNQNSNNNNRRR